MLPNQAAAKAAVKMPSAVGTYTAVMWLPGSDEPGMKAFEDAFMQKYGRLPDSELDLLSTMVSGQPSRPLSLLALMTLIKWLRPCAQATWNGTRPGDLCVSLPMER